MSDQAQASGQNDFFSRYGRPLTIVLMVILGICLTLYSLYAAYNTSVRNKFV